MRAPSSAAPQSTHHAFAVSLHSSALEATKRGSEGDERSSSSCDAQKDARPGRLEAGRTICEASATIDGRKSNIRESDKATAGRRGGEGRGGERTGKRSGAGGAFGDEHARTVRTRRVTAAHPLDSLALVCFFSPPSLDQHTHTTRSSKHRPSGQCGSHATLPTRDAGSGGDGGSISHAASRHRPCSGLGGHRSANRTRAIGRQIFCC